MGPWWPQAQMTAIEFFISAHIKYMFLYIVYHLGIAIIPSSEEEWDLAHAA